MNFLCQRYPEVPITGFLHLQHHPRLICINTKPAVSTAARMDLNISIGMTAIWMVPINTCRRTKSPTAIWLYHPTARYHKLLPLLSSTTFATLAASDIISPTLRQYLPYFWHHSPSPLSPSSIGLTLRHLSNRLSHFPHSSEPFSLSGTPFIL